MFLNIFLNFPKFNTLLGIKPDHRLCRSQQKSSREIKAVIRRIQKNQNWELVWAEMKCWPLCLEKLMHVLIPWSVLLRQASGLWECVPVRILVHRSPERWIGFLLMRHLRKLERMRTTNRLSYLEHQRGWLQSKTSTPKKVKTRMHSIQWNLG